MRKSGLLKMILDLDDRVAKLECKQQILLEAIEKKGEKWIKN